MWRRETRGSFTPAPIGPSSSISAGETRSSWWHSNSELWAGIHSVWKCFGFSLEQRNLPLTCSVFSLSAERTKWIYNLHLRSKMLVTVRILKEELIHLSVLWEVELARCQGSKYIRRCAQRRRFMFLPVGAQFFIYFLKNVLLLKLNECHQGNDCHRLTFM